MPGELCGQRNLAGDSPWGHRESDKTERLTHNTQANVYTESPNTFFLKAKILVDLLFSMLLYSLITIAWKLFHHIKALLGLFIMMWM